MMYGQSELGGAVRSSNSHQANTRRRRNRDPRRYEKLVHGIFSGHTIYAAGRAAGYSESTLKGKIYQIVKSPRVKALIQARITRAALNKEEIIGRLVGHMRGDIAYLFPNDEFMQRAHKMGFSHLIKRAKSKPSFLGFDNDGRPIIVNSFDVEVYSAQEAVKQLSKIFQLTSVPSAQKQDAPSAQKQDVPAAQKQDVPAAQKQDVPAAQKQDVPAARKRDAPAAQIQPEPDLEVTSDAA